MSTFTEFKKWHDRQEYMIIHHDSFERSIKAPFKYYDMNDSVRFTKSDDSVYVVYPDRVEFHHVLNKKDERRLLASVQIREFRGSDDSWTICFDGGNFWVISCAVPTE